MVVPWMQGGNILKFINSRLETTLAGNNLRSAVEEWVSFNTALTPSAQAYDERPSCVK